MPKWVWPSMNRCRMFFIQTSTLSPSMYRKLTQHGRCCMQSNELLTKSHAQSEDNYIGWFVLNWTEQNRRDVDRLCTDHTWEFFWRTLRILRAVVESRPEVGSSRKRMEGSTSISYPILVRLRSPPDTPRMKGPPILVFLHLKSKLERDRPKPNFTKFVSITIFVNLGLFRHFETVTNIRTWIKWHRYWRML
jgi:hypothetical protein